MYTPNSFKRSFAAAEEVNDDDRWPEQERPSRQSEKSTSHSNFTTNFNATGCVIPANQPERMLVEQNPTKRQKQAHPNRSPSGNMRSSPFVIPPQQASGPPHRRARMAYPNSTSVDFLQTGQAQQRCDAKSDNSGPQDSSMITQQGRVSQRPTPHEQSFPAAFDVNDRNFHSNVQPKQSQQAEWKATDPGHSTNPYTKVARQTTWRWKDKPADTWFLPGGPEFDFHWPELQIMKLDQQVAPDMLRPLPHRTPKIVRPPVTNPNIVLPTTDHLPQMNHQYVGIYRDSCEDNVESRVPIDADKIDWDNINWDNIDLDNINWGNVDLDDIGVNNADLDNTGLANTGLENTHLDTTDLDNTDLAKTDWENIDWDSIDLGPPPELGFCEQNGGL